jgi:hypothetical protein
MGWRSRSFGLVAPLRESGTVFGGAGAARAGHSLQWLAVGLATIGVILVQVG